MFDTLSSNILILFFDWMLDKKWPNNNQVCHVSSIELILFYCCLLVDRLKTEYVVFSVLLDTYILWGSFAEFVQVKLVTVTLNYKHNCKRSLLWGCVERSKFELRSFFRLGMGAKCSGGDGGGAAASFRGEMPERKLWITQLATHLVVTVNTFKKVIQTFKNNYSIFLFRKSYDAF